MLYREIIAVCSEIHTQHINTLCGGRVRNFVMLNFVIRKRNIRLFKRLLAISCYVYHYDCVRYKRTKVHVVIFLTSYDFTPS